MSRYLLTHRSAAVELSTLEGTSAGLRESEARFRATFENAAVGIAHVAADGSWLRVNRRLCEIIGYAKDELLAISFQDITHPDDLEADLAQLQRMRDSNSSQRLLGSLPYSLCPILQSFRLSTRTRC